MAIWFPYKVMVACFQDDFASSSRGFLNYTDEDLALFLFLDNRPSKSHWHSCEPWRLPCAKSRRIVWCRRVWCTSRKIQIYICRKGSVLLGFNNYGNLTFQLIVSTICSREESPRIILQPWGQIARAFNLDYKKVPSLVFKRHILWNII